MNEFQTKVKERTETGWKTVASTGDTYYEGAIKTFRASVDTYLSGELKCIRITCMQGKTLLAQYSIN